MSPDECETSPWATKLCGCVPPRPGCARHLQPQGQLREEAALVSHAFWAWTSSRWVRLITQMSEAWMGANGPPSPLPGNGLKEETSLRWGRELRSQVNTSPNFSVAGVPWRCREGGRKTPRTPGRAPPPGLTESSISIPTPLCSSPSNPVDPRFSGLWTPLPLPKWPLSKTYSSFWTCLGYLLFQEAVPDHPSGVYASQMQAFEA